MSRRRAKPRDLSRHAAEVSDEDGTDPREFHAKPFASRKQASRKGRQLCEQVKEALHVALGACGDPVLHSLSIVEVEPAPHTGRLRVMVQSVYEELNRTAIHAHLARATGYLRTEAAGAIHRRYAPELVFELM